MQAPGNGVTAQYPHCFTKAADGTRGKAAALRFLAVPTLPQNSGAGPDLRAERRTAGGVLLQHPSLLTSGVPNLPQLRRLGLTIKWPFHAAPCPCLELRELQITVQDAVIDLGALRYLQLLSRLRIVGVDLGLTLCGLQEVSQLLAS